MLGLRAHCLRLSGDNPGDFTAEASIDLAEISGSETYAHLRRGSISLVAQLPGVHSLEIGQDVTLHFNPEHMFLFRADGALLCAPGHAGA